MAVNAYALYQADGTTPIAIAQPLGATWESVPRGVFASGVQRIALGRRVVWRFDRLTAAQYQAIVQARQPARQTIETWKRPEGGVAGAFVMATAIMAETVPGVYHDGEFLGVSVTFTDVRQI